MPEPLLHALRHRARPRRAAASARPTSSSSSPRSAAPPSEPASRWCSAEQLVGACTSRGSGTARPGSRARARASADPAGAPADLRPPAGRRARGRRRSSRASTCRRRWARAGRRARPRRPRGRRRRAPRWRRSASRATRSERAAGTRRSVGSCPGATDRPGRARRRRDRRERALRSDRPGPPGRVEPGAAAGDSTPSGTTWRARPRTWRLHADARRDQLRLGLVPDAAQAAGLLRLLHGGVGAGRPLRAHGPWSNDELRAMDADTIAACSARSAATS